MRTLICGFWEKLLHWIIEKQNGPELSISEVVAYIKRELASLGGNDAVACNIPVQQPPPDAQMQLPPLTIPLQNAGDLTAYSTTLLKTNIASEEKCNWTCPEQPPGMAGGMNYQGVFVPQMYAHQGVPFGMHPAAYSIQCYADGEGSSSSVQKNQPTLFNFLDNHPQQSRRSHQPSRNEGCLSQESVQDAFQGWKLDIDIEGPSRY